MTFYCLDHINLNNLLKAVILIKSFYQLSISHKHTHTHTVDQHVDRSGGVADLIFI